MRKSILHLLSVLILLMMAGVSLSSASAEPLMVPPLPSSFYGIVKENGQNVPAGTIISAWINGVHCGETQTLFYNGDSVYAMDVSGDDPSTPGIVEGGHEGDAIVFQIGPFNVDQTATWHSGTNVGLNLNLTTLLEKIYLPIIVK